MDEKLKEVSGNIYYVTEDHSTIDYVFHKGEYWFGDATEGINGPFDSKEKCISAYIEYCRRLD